MSKIYVLFFTAFLVCSTSVSHAQDAPAGKNCSGLGTKQIVAGVEVVQLYEIAYHARVDTGANTSSLKKNSPNPVPTLENGCILQPKMRTVTANSW